MPQITCCQFVPRPTSPGGASSRRTPPPATRRDVIIHALVGVVMLILLPVAYVCKSNFSRRMLNNTSCNEQTYFLKEMLATLLKVDMLMTLLMWLLLAIFYYNQTIV